MSAPRRICFDTSAWNALLNKEAEHDLPSIQGIINDFDLGKCVMIIPAVVSCEVAATPNPDDLVIFNGMLDRDNVERIDITFEVSARAGLLRRSVIKSKMKLKTPDALIIACAQAYNADLLISVDGDITRMGGKHGLTISIGKPAAYFPRSLFDEIEEQ